MLRIQREWRGVRFAQGQFITYVQVALVHRAPQLDDYQNLCHSLVLIYAYGVLQDVLTHLRDEGRFKCNSGMLGKLMNDSRAALPWVNFDLVDRGRDRRNDVAHDQKFLSVKESADYVDAIENELIAWNVLSGPVKVSVSYEIRPTS